MWLRSKKAALQLIEIYMKQPIWRWSEAGESPQEGGKLSVPRLYPMERTRQAIDLLMKQKRNNVINMVKRRHNKRDQVLDQLYREHSSYLRQFLKFRLDSSEDHEDVVQDVFLRLARMDDLAEKVGTECNNPRAYIFTIANNIVVDLIRKKIVRRPHDVGQLEQIPEVEVSITPEVQVESAQELEIAKQIILGLSPRVQRAFVLSRFYFKSYKQISDEMGVPVKRVEKYIAKALTKLRDMVETE